MREGASVKRSDLGAVHLTLDGESLRRQIWCSLILLLLCFLTAQLLPLHLAKFVWAEAANAAEHSCEVGRIFEPDRCRDINYFYIRSFEQAFRLIETYAVNNGMVVYVEIR